MRKLILILAVVTISAGCSRSPAPFEPQSISVPTRGDSTGPRLSTGPDSELLLSWMEPGDDGTAVRYSRFRDGAWTPPGSVVENAPLFVNWADLPSVVPLGNDHLAAHWLRKSDGDWYAYDIVFTQSFDGGATWSPPLVPHTDNTPSEHGFVSMTSIKGAAALVWLDGRKMINEVTDDPVASGMTLRAAIIDASETLRAEQVVDELICDCCQTDVALAASGPIAVYRDRSSDEIRDIYVTRHVDGQWQPGNAVASDNWEIAGCPVNGPSIAAQGSKVVVAWFSAAEEPVVRVAISNDSGLNFSAPADVIRSDTLGRVAVVFLDNGDIAVSWLQSSDSGSVINVRRISADGTLGPIHIVTGTAAAFSVPQMVRLGNDLVFAWTESVDKVRRVVSARIDYRSL